MFLRNVSSQDLVQGGDGEMAGTRGSETHPGSAPLTVGRV